MAPTIPQADLLANKTALLLSKSQRLIQSWLSPPSPTSKHATETVAGLEQEDEALFVAEPELYVFFRTLLTFGGGLKRLYGLMLFFRLGVGATVPKDGEMKREELEDYDKLRRQLLGKNWERNQNRRRQEAEETTGGNKAGCKSRLPVQSERKGEESEDDGGRSSLGKSKRKRMVEFDNEHDDTSLVHDQAGSAGKASAGDAHDMLRPPTLGNYLDEVLAERSSRRRKKSKKKRQKAAEPSQD